MKTLLILGITALLTASCSNLDKFKTPETPNAGLGEGEKSSYLLNRPEDSKPAEKSKTITTKKKAKKKTKN